MNDRYDALEAYLQVDRSRGRARLGRQWATNGLGAYNFDGASLLVRRGAHSLEAYGGRALAQGLNESYTSAEIGAVDDLPPEDEGYLVGIRLRARPSDLTALSFVYQRVITGDRSSLFSERIALDGTTRVMRTTVDASLAYDVASGAVNEARLRASRRLGGGIEAAIEGRRHRPFFELWTIWGAFAPVGFDEGRADVSWRAIQQRLQLTVHGAYRRYDETGTGLSQFPLRSNGWRSGIDATWIATDHLMASTSYAVDIGFGASRSDLAAGVRWAPRDRVSVGANVSGLQSIYEFRLGTGRIIGAGIDGTVKLTPDVSLAVDGGLYRHRLTHDAPGRDWSQRRASVRLAWAVGANPGSTRRRSRG